MKFKFKIKGLDCANCAAELERKIKNIDGVNDASISFMSERLISYFFDSRRDRYKVVYANKNFLN